MCGRPPGQTVAREQRGDAFISLRARRSNWSDETRRDLRSIVTPPVWTESSLVGAWGAAALEDHRQWRKSWLRYRSWLVTAVILKSIIPRKGRERLVVGLTAGTTAAGILLVLGLSAQAGCGSPGDSTPCTRVLFIGNSYTSVNDLPSVFAKLARAGGHRVETGRATADGARLADHATSSATIAAITSAKWNIVVLQEQSQIPAIEQFRQAEMYPGARALVAMVRQAGAQPMFFLTWAHRGGWPENGLIDYSTMQSAIDDAYLAIAGEQHAAVAPVGYAWQTLLGHEASPGLWQDDGTHPTEKGTYLAACVFYAAIFGESPEGLAYRGNLSDAEASKLQEVAGATVLGDLGKWGLASSQAVPLRQIRRNEMAGSTGQVWQHRSGRWVSGWRPQSSCFCKPGSTSAIRQGELDARILTTIEHGETLSVLQRDGPIRATPSSRA